MTTTVSSEILMGEKIVALEREVATLRRAIDSKRTLYDLFDRYGDQNTLRAINSGLAGVSETHNIWLAVNGVIRNSIRAEHDAAHTPDLTNEALRTNVARESALEDFQNNLLLIWADANKPVKAA